MSRVPRPQTKPSRSSPPNGSADQSFATAGTTSMWCASTSGRRALASPSVAMTFAFSGDGPVLTGAKPSRRSSVSTQSAAFDTSPGGFVVSIARYACRSGAASRDSGPSTPSRSIDARTIVRQLTTRRPPPAAVSLLARARHTGGMRPPRIAVTGHIEHVTIAGVAALPSEGDIVHLDQTAVIPGGGGGNAYEQLARSPGDIHVFTAIGSDSAGDFVAAALERSGGRVHAVRRSGAHTRDLVLVTPGGERTIFVIGEPLHPERGDPLPWDLLASCDAVYYTAQDPEVLGAARAARLLVVTSRRARALARSGVRADIVVGSAHDPREALSLHAFAPPPRALVMTEGKDGGRIETAAGVARFAAPAVDAPLAGGYGAGDAFAGAFTWYLACGLDLEHACARAARHGAAALRGLNPHEHLLRLDLPDGAAAR
jgi:ribokinase